MNWKARAVVGLIFFCVVCVGYWMTGLPLERGFNATAAFIIAMIALFMGITCPYFDKD